MIFLIIVAILLGVISGYSMFCYYQKITEKFHGPNSNKVKKLIHKDPVTNKCYKFIPQVYMCPLWN